jgi:uncharacterized membrane protein
MYQWVVFVHILAALVWVGGMWFLALVLVPALRREPPDRRAALLEAVGRRFRTVGWVAIAVLLVTGVWNVANRGFGWDVFTAGGRFGHILAGKLALIAVVLALSALHDFRIGPASTRARLQGDDPRRAESLRRLASWIGRVNALLALVVIWLAVALVRGLPWPW